MLCTELQQVVGDAVHTRRFPRLLWNRHRCFLTSVFLGYHGDLRVQIFFRPSARGRPTHFLRGATLHPPLTVRKKIPTRGTVCIRGTDTFSVLARSFCLIGPLHIYVMRDVKWTQWGLRHTNLAKHSMKVGGYRLLFCLECLLSAVFLGAAAMEPFRKVLPLMSSQLRSPCENLGSMQFVEMWDPTFKLYGDRRRFAPFTFAKKIIESHVPERWLVENRSRKMGQTAGSPRRTAISWLLAWLLVCFQASLSDQRRGRDHHRESGRNLPLLLRILLTTRTVRVLIWLILSNLVMTWTPSRVPALFLWSLIWLHRSQLFKNFFLGRRSGQSVTASDFGSNGPRFESGRGRCVESLDKGSLLPLSQGETFTLASISYLAILVKCILAKKKKKKKKNSCRQCS